MIVVLGNLEYYVDHCLQIHKRQSGGVLSLAKNKGGYLKIVIRVKDKTYTYLYHRKVWEWVNGLIPEGMTIDHIDGNKLNNHPSNLQLLSRGDNIIKGHAKLWIAVDPNGAGHLVYNLKAFCKDQGLNVGALYSTSQHRYYHKTHKGWKCYDFSN